jgi:hypothetical protein
MKGMRGLLTRSGLVVAVLLALPFGGWNNANSEEEPEYIKLQLTADGIRIVKLNKVFFAPYTVEPGDTFESISTKFYGRPDYAQNLADALGVPVVHIPRPGSIAYIVSRSLDFRFSAEKGKDQKKTVEEFLAMLPEDKRLTYKYDANPSYTVSDTGKWILTKFDVKAFHIKPANQPSVTLELKFPLQPLLTMIRSGQVLDVVAIEREDPKSKDN